QDDEESIPLKSSRHEDGEETYRSRKGKERAIGPEEDLEPPIFDVGDSEDEDEGRYKDLTVNDWRTLSVN
ncbi:hypothetical protein MPER_03405, partial [Moniliophthora perniciosa FA553]